MQAILLLHGALGSKTDLEPLQKTLSGDFIVYSINFYGHGGDPSTNEFSTEQFARQVLNWMDEQNINSINIVGYSLGGYVALYLALNYPHRVQRVATLGTKLYWDVSAAEKEIAKLDPETILIKVPAYAKALEQRHSPADWKTVLSKTAEMIRHIGQFNPLRLEDFSKINTPVLLMVGDHDKLVTFVETTTVFNELPQGSFAVLPNTPHPISELNIDLAVSILKTFF